MAATNPSPLIRMVTLLGSTLPNVARLALISGSESFTVSPSIGWVTIVAAAGITPALPPSMAPLKFKASSKTFGFVDSIA